MEWMNRLNGAINYIEEHLTREIDYGRLAQIACCSPYHFQRMFSYMADVTLSEYIRRRRMTRAAVDLQREGVKVIDVALRYGYESPTAFNRAFQSVHGFAPSQARAKGAMLKAYPPISFKIMIKGEVEMEYRLETKEAFRILGVSTPLDKEYEKNFEAVPKFWQKAAMEGTIGKLCPLMKNEPMGILGVSACNGKETGKYYIAVSNEADPAGTLEEALIPAATWAVFPGSGTLTSIQKLEERILTEWLPTSGYEYADAPDVEVYLNQDPVNALYEVWIPVIKKEQL